MSVLNGTIDDGESTVEPLSIAVLALQAVGQIFLVLCAGAGLSHVNLLSHLNARYLARLSVNLLLPCLTVVKIAETFTFSHMASWWPLLFFSIFHAICGVCLGHAVRLLSRERVQIENSVVASVICGNHGVIPLALMASMCAEGDGVLSSEATCMNKDAYIFIYTTMSNLIMWSYGFYIVQKGNIDIEPCTLETTVVHGRHNRSASIEMSSSHTEASKAEEEPLRSSDRDVGDPSPSKKPAESDSASERSTNWRSIVEKILSPPAIASIVGIFIGGISWLRVAFVGDGAPLRFATRAMHDLGGGAIPLLMLVLGQSLSKGPSTTGVSEDAVIRRSTIVLTSISRLLIMPLLGFFLVMLLDIGGILPDDPVMKFVLLLEGGVPSALSLVSISQLAGLSEKSTRGISTLLFWQYMASIISTTAMCCVFATWVTSN